MTFIDGGVASAKGFAASGVRCGIRKQAERKDLALILADRECDAAAVFTTNSVKAAPIYVSMKHLENGKARAIIINSGNANACAPNGAANAEKICAALSKEANIDIHDIIVNSTGVIGKELPAELIVNAIGGLVSSLGTDGSDAAASAIMTTDTVKKEISVRFTLGGTAVTIGAIAKGSGMIHPNMATLLCLITTDCHIDGGLLGEALKAAVDKSFNSLSIDGDTSTNDMTAILASGAAGNRRIVNRDDDYKLFCESLETVCVKLAKLAAKDGEGATKLITCRVTGARSEAEAKKLSMSVTSSSLVKAMITGSDANWGRVICAMGYAGTNVRQEDVSISFASDEGTIDVCSNGTGLPFDEVRARKILERDEITIICALANAETGFSYETYGCDLTSEYVKINGDYRS